MSVFTPVSQSQLAAWLTTFSVGAPVGLEPIAAGIENTNYFVTTAQGRYVLTLFPMYVSLALASRSRASLVAISAVSLAAMVYFTGRFATGWWAF